MLELTNLRTIGARFRAASAHACCTSCCSAWLARWTLVWLVTAPIRGTVAAIATATIMITTNSSTSENPRRFAPRRARPPLGLAKRSFARFASVAGILILRKAGVADITIHRIQRLYYSNREPAAQAA